MTKREETGRRVPTRWHSYFVISFFVSTGFPFMSSSVTATDFLFVSLRYSDRLFLSDFLRYIGNRLWLYDIVLG